jgi:murein DD-endopeptidase MepM/ murein hydrolase activator NlpD
MTGENFRAAVNWAAIVGLSIAAAGCIPRGASDYRIGTATPRPTAQAPVIVPESDVLYNTPSWSPKAVERNSKQVTGGTYTVEAGDSLYRIVSKTGASFADIAAANNLTEPYLLQLGQVLQIPRGLYHQVNAGETGIAIARAYGVSWSEIISLNALEQPYILNIGQRLRLPSGAALASSQQMESGEYISPEQQAAGFSLNIDDVATGSEPALVEAETRAVTPNADQFEAKIVRPESFGGSFIWPVQGALLSSFGSKGGGKVNDGINLAAAEGTPVGASGSGVVVYSGNEIGVFGGLILVDHGGGWVTAYGHLSQLAVARGDRVRPGQILGNVGETGYVDQPQLHFEIRRDRKPVNPATMLPIR